MAVVVAAAVLVGVFVMKPQMEQSSEPVSLENWEDYYHEEIPLTKVPWYILNRYAELATALPEHGEPKPDDRLELPVDVHYYTSPNASGEPAYTIPKGTVVSLFVGGDRYLTYTQMGYGYCCFPDYQAGWRYGIPFVTEGSPETASDWADEQPKYYVQTSELEAVAQAFWEANQNSPEIQAATENLGGEEEFVHWLVRLPDQQIEDGGYFDAPDYP